MILFQLVYKLAGAEVELIKLKGRKKRLKKALDQIKPNYDYILLISLSSSLGLLTINSLTAVDSDIPIQCEFLRAGRCKSAYEHN